MPPPDTTSPAADTPAPSAPAPRRTWRRAGGWLAALLLGLGLLLAGGLGWLWRSEPGTYWLLTQVPGLKLENWKGALGGDALTADRLTLTLSSGELVLEKVSLQGLRWRWRPDPQSWAGIAMTQLRASSAHWQSRATPEQAPTSAHPPADLRLPVQLEVGDLQLAHLQIDSLPALSALRASLHLGARNGQQHQLTLTQLETDRFRLSGTASLMSEGEMRLQSQLALQSLGEATPAWQATLSAQGPLAQLEAQGQLLGQAPAGEPAPAVQFQTRLQPFASWPLGDLQLKTEALNLAALSSQAPHTRLRGSITLHSSGLHQPAQAELALHNDLPGRWDEQRLPLRQLSLRAAGTPEPLTELRLTQLALEFANAQGGAGRWQGEGLYRSAQDGQAELSLQVQDFLPAALDPRLPAVQLSGPLKLALAPLHSHSPSPSPAGPASATSPAASTAPSTAASPPSAPAALAQAVLAVQAKLTGRLQRPGEPTPPVALALNGRGSLHEIQIDTLTLKADQAYAELKGRLQRGGADGRLHWQLDAQLQELDPRVWWPGPPDSAWRQTPERLNATLRSEASLPEALFARAASQPQALWRALRGQVALQLAPSQLGGVPIQGQLQVRNDDQQQQADAELSADDARLQAHWHDDPGSTGRGELSLKAPRLGALAAWPRLLPEAAAWAPTEGALELSLTLAEAGRPDQWRWRAEGETRNLVAGPLQLAQAKLQGSGDLREGWPLSLQLSGRQLSLQQTRLSQLNASLSGSLAQHSLQLALDSPLQPPPWFQRLIGSKGKPGAKLQLQADGRYTESAQGSDWALHLGQLLLRGSEAGSQDWLAARDLQAQLHWSPDGRLAQAQLAPGELLLPHTAVQWTQAHYTAPNAGQPPQVVLQAKLRDVMAAPLLQRLQPEAVWSGDLQLGGHLQLRYDGRLDAEAVLERLGGDLSLDEDGLQVTPRQLPLGLSDLRLGLRVHEGRWELTEGLAGQYLGALGAALTVTTTPEALWPDKAAKLQGAMTLKVTNLGAWAAWAPPGWRLGGELASTAQFNGRFGAPEISGELTGQNLSVQNPLMGVQLSKGQARLLLEGDKARLEQLSFKGGEGSISAQGTAELGASPSAKLDVQAKRFRALGRIDRTIIASGQAQLQLNRDTLSLNGQVGIDEGLIDISRGDAPSLPDDVVTARQEAEQEAQDDKANGQSQRVTQLALQVDLGQKLRLRGKGLDTSLQGALKISNPRGKLAVNGTVHTVDGHYAAYSQKLVIERGSILFTGPVDDPRLDIYAIRPNLDVKVGVAITGTALNPRVRLASDTDMSDTDKLSWLVMGRAPEGLGQADTALLQRAALALLMGNSGGSSDNLLDTIGLSDFSLRQATGENNVQTTVVTVGKQLTRRWYVGYERGVNAAAGTWQLIYRVAQRFTLRAQSGEDSALDAIWTWRWD